ncbi:MAG: hypothetical protein P8N17_09895 [Luminiphilus sp.]|nr:hypothetical protein [Luminiphilus sp.]
MTKVMTVLFALLAPISGWTDDQTPTQQYLGFYYFSAPDPAAVVSAVDKFYASDCGKRYPADVALAEQVFNGSDTSTHFFLNTYEDAAAQQEAAEIFRSCPAAIAFLTELSESDVVFTMEHLSFALVAEGDSTKDFAFAKFDVKVEPQHQQAYAMAFATMMGTAAKDVALRSYGNNLAGFGNDKFTNSVYVGAETLTQLAQIQQALLVHPAYADFSKKTSGMRENVNTTQVLFIKSYPRQQ